MRSLRASATLVALPSGFNRFGVTCWAASSEAAIVVALYGPPDNPLTSASPLKPNM